MAEYAEPYNSKLFGDREAARRFLDFTVGWLAYLIIYYIISMKVASRVLKMKKKIKNKKNHNHRRIFTKCYKMGPYLIDYLILNRLRTISRV